VFNQNNFG
jgi:hypothetical protein